MKIVVDIPKNILDIIQADEMISRDKLAVLQMHILNGKILPKGHGRLIDADKLVEVAEKIEEDGATLCIDKSEDLETFLDDEVPTVLDADYYCSFAERKEK